MRSSSTRSRKPVGGGPLTLLLAVLLCQNACVDEPSSPTPKVPPLKLLKKSDAGVAELKSTTTTASAQLGSSTVSTPQTPTLTAWMSASVVTDGGPSEKNALGPAAPKIGAAPSTSVAWQLPSSPKALVWTHPLPVVAAPHFSLSLESRAGTPWPAEIEYTQRNATLLEARLVLLEPLPSGDQLSLVAKSGAGRWRVPLTILQGSTERPPWKRTPPKKRRRRSRRRR